MKPEFSRPVEIRPFLEEGRELTLSASADEAAALARRFKIPAVESFEARITSAKDGPGLYTLSGDISARLTRTCVRTLEPMEETVAECFEVTFAEPSVLEDFGEERGAGPEDIEVIGEAPVDLGELAAQYLSLMMSQHPVSPSAPPPLREPAKAKQERSPFAVLKGLKTGQGNQ